MCVYRHFLLVSEKDSGTKRDDGLAFEKSQSKCLGLMRERVVGSWDTKTRNEKGFLEVEDLIIF